MIPLSDVVSSRIAHKPHRVIHPRSSPSSLCPLFNTRSVPHGDSGAPVAPQPIITPEAAETKSLGTDGSTVLPGLLLLSHPVSADRIPRQSPGRPFGHSDPGVCHPGGSFPQEDVPAVGAELRSFEGCRQSNPWSKSCTGCFPTQERLTMGPREGRSTAVPMVIVAGEQSLFRNPA